MAAITTIGALAIAITGIWQGVELGDRLVLSEAEAAVQFAERDNRMTGLEEDLAEDRLINECRWLQDKLDEIEYEIYVLQRDGADGDFIRSKEAQLKKVERRYSSLDCAAVLDV